MFEAGSEQVVRAEKVSCGLAGECWLGIAGRARSTHCSQFITNAPLIPSKSGVSKIKYKYRATTYSPDPAHWCYYLFIQPANHGISEYLVSECLGGHL